MERQSLCQCGIASFVVRVVFALRAAFERRTGSSRANNERRRLFHSRERSAQMPNTVTERIKRAVATSAAASVGDIVPIGS